MKKIISGLILGIFLVSAGSVYAQLDGSTGSSGHLDGSTGSQTQTQNQTLPKLDNPLTATSVKDVIFLAVKLAIYVGTAFAILAIIFVGFKFVEARGNEEKLKDAKKWFLYVIVGFAILISARVIVEIVQNTLINSGVVERSVWSPPN